MVVHLQQSPKIALENPFCRLLNGYFLTCHLKRFRYTELVRVAGSVWWLPSFQVINPLVTAKTNTRTILRAMMVIKG